MLPVRSKQLTSSQALMQTWHPKTYRALGYLNNYCCTSDINNQLEPASEDCQFTGITVNFPNSTTKEPVYTWDHRDCRDFWMMAQPIVSSGEYDHEIGGHLIVHELKLLIEFPPGCFIFLPSAILTHANVKVADHEKRSSFACYANANLFDYVFGKEMAHSFTWTKMASDTNGNWYVVKD